jgi:hypothetical protein
LFNVIVRLGGSRIKVRRGEELNFLLLVLFSFLLFLLPPLIHDEICRRGFYGIHGVGGLPPDSPLTPTLDLHPIVRSSIY